VSDTDTEVLAHLVEDRMAAGDRLVDALAAALRHVRGSFSVSALSPAEPETLVAARRVSPLIVGLGDGVSLLASDIPALLGHTRRLFSIDDDQVVELWPGGMRVRTLDGLAVEPKEMRIDWDLEAAEKEGQPDFMSKEIAEQPRAVADTLLDRRRADGTLLLDETRLGPQALAEVEKVCIVACGSSYHAAMVAKYAIEHWTRLPTEVDIASEFRYRDPVLHERTLAVGVSQSGETADTVEAMREARRWGATLLVVSNTVDSSMARESDGVLYTRAGPEIGVAATKTHLAQVVALELLALNLAQAQETLRAEEIDRLFAGLGGLAERVQRVIERAPEVDAVAEGLVGARDYFFIGRHVGYPVALEGALKLKEISYLRAEGYPAGELKHGPLALIEPGTVVVAVATRSRLWEKVMANVAEVKSRGATVVVVAEDGDEVTAAQADHVLWVPAVPELLSPVVDVVPLQLLAYRLARLHGHDVDRPRNLAKTVTVE
jgi:glucosamine--fructose-6-phosphate aminotransferase (isomerizing)